MVVSATSTPAPSPLARAALAARELRRRRAARPLDYVRWFRPQARWLALDARIKLFRAGNQIVGKTWAGIAEVVWRCLGTHPRYPTKVPPIKVIVCNLNKQQSRAIQAKFAELIPAEELADGCAYNSGTGWGENNPRIKFRNGSVIRFVTDDQGPRSVAGATVDFVWVDEPCSPEMMRELRQRLVALAGSMAITLTPINGPVRHIEELVKSGEVEEVHAPLCLDTLTYDGSDELRVLPDGVVCDDAWIKSRRAKESPLWAGIILDGEWAVKQVGALFAPIWDRKRHVTIDPKFAPDATTFWRLGIDYALADRAAGTVATLVEVEPFQLDDGTYSENVIIHDQVVHPGTATMDMLGKSIRAMLSRHPVGRWRNLRTVHGDNAVQGRFEYKSNLELEKRIARQEGVPISGLRPRVRGAKEGRISYGAVQAGEAYVYERMAQGQLLVAARCEPLIEAIEGYVSGVATDKYKDRIDSLRYALKPEIEGTTNPHAKVTLRVA